MFNQCNDLTYCTVLQYFFFLLPAFKEHCLQCENLLFPQALYFRSVLFLSKLFKTVYLLSIQSKAPIDVLSNTAIVTI